MVTFWQTESRNRSYTNCFSFPPWSHCIAYSYNLHVLRIQARDRTLITLDVVGKNISALEVLGPPPRAHTKERGCEGVSGTSKRVSVVLILRRKRIVATPVLADTDAPVSTQLSTLVTSADVSAVDKDVFQPAPAHTVSAQAPDARDSPLVRRSNLSLKRVDDRCYDPSAHLRSMTRLQSVMVFMCVSLS